MLRRRRRFVDTTGRTTTVAQRRLVRMDEPHLAALHAVFTVEDWTGGSGWRQERGQGLLGAIVAQPEALEPHERDSFRRRAVIERTISWLLRFKRLGLRYDRTEKTLTPLLTLAMVLINLRRLVAHEF